MKLARWPDASQIAGGPRMAASRQHDVVAELDHGADPRLLHVAQHERAEGAVVVGGPEPAVDLGRRIDEAPSLAEVDDLVEVLGRHREARLRGGPNDPAIRSGSEPAERSSSRAALHRWSGGPPVRLTTQSVGVWLQADAATTTATRREGVLMSRGRSVLVTMVVSYLVAACMGGGSEASLEPSSSAHALHRGRHGVIVDGFTTSADLPSTTLAPPTTSPPTTAAPVTPAPTAAPPRSQWRPLHKVSHRG